MQIPSKEKDDVSFCNARKFWGCFSPPPNVTENFDPYLNSLGNISWIKVTAFGGQLSKETSQN